ncbi:MAG: hypothetical protein JSU66_13515 [Deltaproteobacteria bacterium]|nr:MAG: hypothetical protein JSU66_13515 [Deltaproteobacteria bacterium]
MKIRVVLAALACAVLACATPPPVVNVEAPPCQCDCAFRATTPEIGRGCWVQGDVLVCPLVVKTIDIEPAYPGSDPRCEKQDDGTLRCEVSP